MNDSSCTDFFSRTQSYLLFGIFFALSFFLAVEIDFFTLILLVSSIIIFFLILYYPELGFALFLLIGVLKNITTQFPVDLTLLLFIVTCISMVWKFIQNKLQCDITNKYFLSVVGFTLLVIIGYFYTKSPHAGLLKASRYVVFNMFLFIGGLSIGYTKNHSEKFIKILFVLLLIYSLIYIYFFKDVIGMNIQELAEYHLRFTLIGNPIGVGRIFSVLVIISLIYFLHKKKIRIVFIIGLILGLLITLATNSRGPLVALLLTLFIYLYLFSGIKKSRLLSITIAFVILFIILLSVLPKNFVSRYTFGLSKEIHVSETEVKFFSTSQEREMYLKQAIDYLSEHPERLLLGTGTGSFSYISKHIDDRLYPHNIFVEIILEFGILGLLLFIFPFIFLLIDFIQNKRTFTRVQFVNISIWISLTILFFINAQVSGDINDNRLLWFFMGGLIGLILFIMQNNTIRNINEV